MPRRPRNYTLESRESRTKLKARREPYWFTVKAGLAVGYRKHRGSAGGSWIVRRRVGSRYAIQSVGPADDHQDADGKTVFSYEQVLESAFTPDQASATPEGKMTLAQVVDAYLLAFQGKSYDDVKGKLARVMKHFGNRKTLAALTADDIRAWQRGAVRDRVKRNAMDIDDAEKERRAKDTANRLLTALKAALNHAYTEGRTKEKPWDRVKPFRGVGAQRHRFLSPTEVRRILAKMDDDLRHIATASLLTGGRYSEVASLTVDDYDRRAKTVHFRKTKASRPRHSPLTDEGVTFFDAMTGGRDKAELIFLRSTDVPWKRADQRRPMESAVKDAKLSDIVFHDFRRTYGSRLAERDVSLQVIAELLGHADTRMCEAHYAHLQEGHAAKQLRAKMPEIGIKPSKVARI